MTYANVVSVPTEKYNIYDIHHPMERYLPSYLVVGASLQKSKLQKVNAKSKSQLALPRDKTTIVPIWASKCFLTSCDVMYYTRNGSDTSCNVSPLSKDVQS
jgi:hypothetical protein